MDDQRTVYTLQKGKEYRVKTAFRDYDNRMHPVGEVWTFDRTTYLPYDSGLSLFVIQSGVPVMYRFQDNEEEQGPLLHTFRNYVEPTGNECANGEKQLNCFPVLPAET